MITTRCPECGKPAELSLASPDHMSCAACGYAGPPPGDTPGRLREAAGALEGLDRAQRQLSGFSRRILGAASTRTIVFLLTAAGVSLPFALCLASATSAQLSRAGTVHLGHAVTWLVCASPLLFMAGFALVGNAWIGRKIGALRLRLAATPPPRPGEPAACHVCGGPVTSSGAEAFSRCGYCGADNLVLPEVLHRRVDAAVADVADFAASVRGQSEGVAAVAKQAQRLVLVGAVVAAAAGWGLGGCIGCGFSMLVLDREVTATDAETHSEAEYAWMETDQGECLAEVRRRDDGSIELDASNRGHRTVSAAEAAELQTSRAPDLVGQRLVFRRPGFSDAEGTVTRVVGTLGGDVDWELRRDDGSLVRVHSAHTLCRP